MKVVDRMLEWENAGGFNLLKVGYSLRPPELLFRKIEDEEIEAELTQLRSNLTAKKSTMDSNPVSPSDANEKSLKPEIVFDDFGKIDLRVGTIIDAKKVEKADKRSKKSQGGEKKARKLLWWHLGRAVGADRVCRMDYP